MKSLIKRLLREEESVGCVPFKTLEQFIMNYKGKLKNKGCIPTEELRTLCDQWDKKIVKNLVKRKDFMDIRKKKNISEDVDSTISLPNLRADDGLLSINGKRYKLIKETFLKDLKITVHNVIVEKNGDIKLDASALGLPRQTNKVGKHNIDMVIKAVDEGKRKIKVKNASGTEFTLIKV